MMASIVSAGHGFGVWSIYCLQSLTSVVLQQTEANSCTQVGDFDLGS